MFLQLSGQPREAIFESDIKNINSENLVENISEKLDTLSKLFRLWGIWKIWEIYSTFTYVTTSGQGDYIIECKKLYTKIKNSNMTLPWSFRLMLKSIIKN